MIQLLVYDPTTGRILRRVTSQVSAAHLQARPGEAWMPGDGNDMADYVIVGLEGPMKYPRPAMAPRWNNVPPRADGVDVALLLDLPDPCSVVYEGPGFRIEGEVAGGTAEFTTDAPGAHRITVSAWPHLDWEGGFDAI